MPVLVVLLSTFLTRFIYTRHSRYWLVGAISLMMLGNSQAASSSLLSLPNVSGVAGSTVSLPISFTSGTGNTAGLQWTFSLPPNSAAFTAQAGPSATAAGKTLYCQGNICLLTGLNANT